jgi:hypothetical protein
MKDILPTPAKWRRFKQRSGFFESAASVYTDASKVLEGNNVSFVFVTPPQAPCPEEKHSLWLEIADEELPGVITTLTNAGLYPLTEPIPTMHDGEPTGKSKILLYQGCQLGYKPDEYSAY